MTDRISRDKFIEIELSHIKRLFEEKLPEHDTHFDMTVDAYNAICEHLDHIISRTKGDYIIGLEIEEEKDGVN